MDIFIAQLDFSRSLTIFPAMADRVPEYALYGERPSVDRTTRPDVSGRADAAGQGGFWIHCEAIRDRSRLHGWEIRPHFHRGFVQLLYIRVGEGDILTGHARIPMRVPTLIEVPRGAVHGFRFSRNVEGFVLSLVPEALALVLADTAAGAPAAATGVANDGERLTWPRLLTPRGPDGALDVRQTFLDPDDPLAARLATLLAEIPAEYALRTTGYRLILSAQVLACLAMAERLQDEAADTAANASDPAPPSDLQGRSTRRLEQLERLIAAHGREHRPVAFYAAELGLSPSQLNRLCRKERGASLRDMLAGRLFDEACRSLVFTMLSVKEIAYNLGFQDPAYFTRFFTRHAGEHPTAYRHRASRPTGQGPGRSGP